MTKKGSQYLIDRVKSYNYRLFQTMLTIFRRGNKGFIKLSDTSYIKLKFIFIVLLSASLTVVAGTFSTSVVASPPPSLIAQTSESQQAKTTQLGTQFLQEGQKLYEIGQFTEAVKALQQGSDAFRTSGDSLGEALAQINLSLAWQQLGGWQEAKTAIASSLQLVDQQQQTSQTVKVKAQALNTQGSLEFAQGQPDKAISTWQQAAKLYSQIGDETGKNRTLVNQAQALQSMGLYRRAVETLQAVNKNLQTSTNSSLKTAALRSYGNALRLVGDLDESKKVLEQSLKYAQQQSSNQDICDTLLSLGNTVRAQQDLNAALDYYQQAANTNASTTSQMRARVNQLSLLVETQQDAEALALWSKIQPLLSNLAPTRPAIEAKINVAQSLLKLSSGNKGQEGQDNPEDTSVKTTLNSSSLNIPEIATILATAIREAKSIGDMRTQSYALGQLGAIYEQNQQLDEANKLTQQALLLSQSLNASEITYRWQWQMGRIAKAQGDNDKAIAAYTEAINILKSLRSDLVAINSDVQFSFRESVEPIYRQFVGLLLQANGSNEPSQEQLTKARSVIESLQLAELDNFFQEACLQAKPTQIDKVDRTAAVIYPIILDDRLEVILSVPQQPVRHYSTALGKTEVESLLDQLKQTLSPVGSSKQRLRLSQQVYDWLIRPAKADLDSKGVKTLVFVLDGALRNFPMAALYDGKQYLVEQYSIAISPGLQLLESRPLIKSQFQVLTAGLSESRQGFSALPAVQIELNQIASEVPGKLLLNEDLTSTKIQNQLASAPFPVIHLATHGQFSSKAKDTFILTWDGRINVKDLDQLLRARGQQGDSSPLELLVLSACQTASGDKRATLGLAGVAVRSGARSTLASLWSVKDDATAALMTNFYRQLQQPGATKAEALRQAQISLLKNRQFSNPLYWAPFVLVGNWI